MYKLSYEKCVCFIFLVILVFLSCSGFHTDRLVTLTDHNNKKYPFTSSSSLNENVQRDSEFLARLMNIEMETTPSRKWGGGGGMHFAGVPGVGASASLAEGVDQPPPHPPRFNRRRRPHKHSITNSITPKDHLPPRTISVSAVPRVSEQQQQLEDSPLVRDRRGAPRGRNNKEQRRRKGDRKFCPGQDVGTRAYHAKTIIEGRVRSRKIPNNSTNYAVTVEVKRIHRNESSFRALNITDIIRLHFANGQHKGCDQKLVHGLVPAQLVNGNSYIFFLKSVGVHNYTVIGLPVPNDAKKVQKIQDIIVRKKMRPAKIVNPRITNQTIKLNEELNLTCVVRGNPPPIITWYKDGSEIRGKRKKLRIKYMERKSFLLIPQVESSDAGKYECRAKGVFGKEVSTSSFVTIQNSEFPEGAPCQGHLKDNYCLNDGTCFYYRSLGEMACRCSNGYIGQRCEKKDVTSQTSTYTRTVYCKLGLSNTFYC